MRIIAGKAGRIRLDVPRGSGARPTTDRVREALFSILGERVVGERVLDLYAGSGALGLEALSRGAAEAVFVEMKGEACKVIGQNIERAGFKPEEARVRKGTVEFFLKGVPQSGGGRYGLIFADPPYRKGGVGNGGAGPLVESSVLPEWLEPEGWLVLEMAADECFELKHGWEVGDERRYGGTKTVILSRSDEK